MVAPSLAGMIRERQVRIALSGDGRFLSTHIDKAFLTYPALQFLLKPIEYQTDRLLILFHRLHLIFESLNLSSALLQRGDQFGGIIWVAHQGFELASSSVLGFFLVFCVFVDPPPFNVLIIRFLVLDVFLPFRLVEPTGGVHLLPPSDDFRDSSLALLLGR